MYFVTRCEDSSLEVIPDADQTHLISENHFVPLYICFHIINTKIEIVFFAAGDHRIKSGLLSTNPDIHTETRIHPHPISGKDSQYWENTFFYKSQLMLGPNFECQFYPKIWAILAFLFLFFQGLRYHLRSFFGYGLGSFISYSANIIRILLNPIALD